MIMNRTLFIASLAVSLIFSAASDGWSKKKGKDCSEAVRTLILKYEKGRNAEVIAEVTELRKNCSGHQAMDTALYYLGRAYLRKNQPVEARMEFELLLQDYPSSTYRDEVNFLVGYCSYKQSPSYELDQTKTYDAIRDLSEFIEMYPGSKFADSAAAILRECNDKLAKKEFLSARFYERIEQFEAAIVYYKNMLKKFPSSGYYAESRLYLAKNLIRVNRNSEAAEILDQILGSDDAAEIKRQAQLLRDQIKKS